jgi:hypothetical protein
MDHPLYLNRSSFPLVGEWLLLPSHSGADAREELWSVIFPLQLISAWISLTHGPMPPI